MPKERRSLLRPYFSKDGTTSGIDFSKDGSKVAYAISEGGSDWSIIMDAFKKNNRRYYCRCKI
jgi:hypothetical protein